MIDAFIQFFRRLTDGNKIKNYDRLYSGLIVLPDGRFEVDRDALHRSDAYKQQVRALHILVHRKLNKKQPD